MLAYLVTTELVPDGRCSQFPAPQDSYIRDADSFKDSERASAPGLQLPATLNTSWQIHPERTTVGKGPERYLACKVMQLKRIQ